MRRAPRTLSHAGVCLLLLSAACSASEAPETPRGGRPGGAAVLPPGDAGTTPDAEPREEPDPPPTELLERLRAIEGLDVTEIAPRVEGTRAFLLGLSQPQDHALPDGPRLRQRLVLVHRSVTAPMVLMTTGYALFGDLEEYAGDLSEPTVLLEANQLAVEHRYFGTSIAEDPDWSHLTVEQSAADSHRIVELLGAIYTGPWVGTGYSKGGMTAIFHDYHHPDDLAAIVPYVSPISFGAEDPRYLEWVDQIGPEDGECRRRVQDMAVEMIERRAEAAQYFLDTDPAATSIRRDVLEALVTYPAYFSFHWTFWQYRSSAEVCRLLPARGKPIERLTEWFPLEPSYLTDPGEFDPEVSPYDYQAARELGWPAIDDDYLSPAVDQVDYSVMPVLTTPPPPWGDSPALDPQPMRAVDRFLREDAEHVLAIYGKWDPWTGGAAAVNVEHDNAVVTVPGANHAATLADLPEEAQAQLIGRLHEWIGRRALVAARGPSAQTRAAIARIRADARGHQALAAKVTAAERALARAHALRRARQR